MKNERTIIVPVSGGKDSQVVLDLALKLRRKRRIVAVHQNTGFDHSLTYKQMKDMEKFYGIKIEHTKSSKFKNGMFDFLDSAQYFPNSAARGCTSRLKQEPFARWLIKNGFTPENCEIWFGMRGSDESASRTSKYGDLEGDDYFELKDIAGFYGKGWRKKLGSIPVRLPIVQMTTAQVFEYIKKTKAPLNKLYARGHVRVGCYPCLLSRKSEWELAGKDREGREHIVQLVRREDRWKKEKNPRKFIKVHRKWDVRKFITGKASDLPDLTQEECGYCSI